MRKKYYTVLSILIFLFLIQHILIKQPNIFSAITAKESFRDVEITMLDSSFEPIGYYEGKEPVILVFWASDIEPCKFALDDLKKDAGKWKEKYVFKLIAVNVGESAEQVRVIRDLWAIDFEIGLDPDGKIARTFGVSTLPSIIALNIDGSTGRIISRYDPEMTSEISRFLRKVYEAKDSLDEGIDTIKAID